MYKYSILTFIFNGYEKLREVKNKQDDVEYICVTDDKSLTSNTWNIICDSDLDGKGPFDKCFSVRYNPFKYCHSDICVRIDGSIQVCGSLDKVIEDFNKGNYDVCLMIHPYRNNLLKEYSAWVNFRNYSMEKALNACRLIKSLGYDFNYKSMFQLNFSILRRNKINDDINYLTYALLRLLGDKKDNIDRLDQTVFSFVINKFFQDLNIMPVLQDIIDNENILTWHYHNKDGRIHLNKTAEIEPYLFNKKIEVKKY